MFILGNFFIAISKVLQVLLNFAMWIIIIQALISWVNPDPYNPIVRFLYSAADPMLRPIRRRLPVYSLGIDISPLIAILFIIFMQSFLVESLRTLGLNLR